MKEGLNREAYLDIEIPNLKQKVINEKDPLKKSILEARLNYLEREKSYSALPKEFNTGVITGAAIGIGSNVLSSSVKGVIATVGALSSIDTQKIEISEFEKTKIQNEFPEFYRINRDKFIVKESVNGNNYSNKTLETLQNFYMTEKTPDEKLVHFMGGAIGANEGGKLSNTKIKSNALPVNNTKQNTLEMKEINGKWNLVDETLSKNPTIEGKINTSNEKILYVSKPTGLLKSSYETYYRTISQEHFNILQNTGKMPAGHKGETFISPSLTYVQKYNYGITLEFKLKPGTTDELMKIGVKNRGNGVMTDPMYNYLKLQKASNGWGNKYAMFKLETTLQKTPLIKDKYNVNIGLGKEGGTALEIFNKNLIDYNRIER